MSDIAHLGFSVSTRGLQVGMNAMNKYARTGSRMEASVKASVTGMAAAAAAAAASMLALTNTSATYAREIRTAARLSSMSTQDFQKMAFATKQVGIGVEKLGDISKDTLEKVGDYLNTGGGGFQDYADAMRLSKEEAAATANEFKNLSGPAVLQEMVKRMEEANVSAVQMSHALEGMASDTTNLLPLLRDGGASMADLSQKIASVTVPLTSSDLEVFVEMGQASDLALESLKSLSNTILLDLSNSFIKGAEKAAHFYASLNKGTEAQKTTRLADIADEINRLKEGMENAKTVAGRLWNSITMNTAQEKFALEQINELEKERLKIHKELAKSRFGIGEKAPKKKAGGLSADIVTPEQMKIKDAMEDVTASLKLQIIALEEGEEAANRWAIAQKLGLDSVEAIPASIKKHLDALDEIKKKKDELAKADAKNKKQTADLKALTNSVNNFGGAWSRTGNIIVDSFGSMSDAMGDYSQRMSELGKKESEIAEMRAKGSATNAELNALQMQVNSERVSAELSGLSALSSATSAMFGEKSKAAKAFSALNKVIAIAEIAMSFKKMAASTAEAGVHVTNEGVKQSANALTAITSAFAAPFPIGFAAGAAMIGVMGGLIGSAFSGGSFTDSTEARQDKQGTGSVLGSDGKSTSLTDSQERFEGTQLSQLSELKSIRNSMGGLVDAIAQVTKGLVASGGFGEYSGTLGSKGVADGLMGDNFASSIVSGFFGKTKTKVTDSGIKFVATSLSDILDGGVVGAQQYFDVTKTKKKLFGALKKVSTSTSFEDIDSDFANQVGSIFKDIGSVISESTSLLGFDVESALNAFQIDLGSISLEGLSGKEIEEQLQAIFSRQADLITGAALPDLKEFQKVGEGLFETLSRVTQEQAVFNDVTRSMGMNLNELSSIMQIEVAQSVIDLIGGLEQFSELSNAFVDKFYSDAEKFAMLESDLGDVFNTVGLGMVTTREEFRALVEGLDLTNAAQREVYATLLEVSPAFDEYVKGLKKVKEGLEDAVLNSFGKLEQAIKLQKNGAQAALDVAQEAHNAELDRIESLRGSLEAENELRTGNLATAEEALNNSFNAEIVRINEKAAAEIEAANAASQAQIAGIKDASTARIAGLKSEKSVLSKTASSMRSLVSAINGTMKSLKGGGDLTAALQAARGGDLSQAKELDIKSLAKLDASNFLSAEDLKVQEAVNQNQLKEIGDIAGTQLSHAERQLLGIENQVAATKGSAAAQIEAIQVAAKAQAEAIRATADNDTKALQDQLNALLGIDTTNLSMADATAKYQEAKMALDSVNYTAELGKLDMLTTSANDVYLLHQEAYAKEIERLDGILLANQAIVDVALGIDSSVMSVAEAVTGLNGAITSLAASNAAAQRVPENPVKETATHFKHTSNEVIVDKLESIDKKNSEIQMQMLRNSQMQASALQQFKLDGMVTKAE
ncbi:MAG: hypothetical protein GY738_26540 [Pseudoalteromonas sp.]|nr:hypothetical protein [Pseudoalteromonas sp.]